MSTEEKGHRTEIIIAVVVAIVGFVGAILQALIGENWISNPFGNKGNFQTFGPEIITCDSRGQVCNNRFTKQVTTNKTLKVQYVIPGNKHCSPISINFYLDGKRVHSTDLLGWDSAPTSSEFSNLPTESKIIDLSPVESGTHSISLEARGEEVGCNKGRLSSWSGILKVWTSREN